MLDTIDDDASDDLAAADVVRLRAASLCEQNEADLEAHAARLAADPRDWPAILALCRRFVARAREIDRLHLLFHELIGMEPPADFRSVAEGLDAPDPGGLGRGG